MMIQIKRLLSWSKKFPDLTDQSKRDDLFVALEELTVTTQDMLKAEWEKVKAEAKDGDIKD